MPATFPRRRAALLAMTGLALAAAPAAAEPPWDGRSILCETCDSSTTDLAVASNGLSVVGWIDDGVVRAAIREAGDASFGAALDISAKGNPTDISVAAGNRGEAIVAWRWREPGDELGGRIQARVIGADGVAGPIEDLTQAAAAGTDPGGAARLTEVVIDGQGTAYAVWNRATVLGFRVESRVRPASGAWGPHTFVSTHAAGNQSENPVLAANPTAGAIVLWLDRGVGLWRSSVTTGGAWGAQQDVTGSTTSAFVTGLSMDRAGNALAAWNTGSAGSAAGYRPARKAWNAPQAVAAGENTPSPRVGLDSAGNALIATRGIQIFRRDSLTGAIGLPQKPSGGADTQALPRLGVSPAGSATLIGQDARTAGLFDQFASLGSSLNGRFGPTERIGPEALRANDGRGRPGQQVGVDVNGTSIALWSRGKASGGSQINVSVRPSGRGGTVKETAAQLKTNQRISQAAVRRANALIALLKGGLGPGNIRDGSLIAADFNESVSIGGAETTAVTPPGTIDPVPVAAPKPSSGTVRFTPGQLRTNQRISQVAVLRANAVADLLSNGLTGQNVRDASLDGRELAAGLSIAGTDAAKEPTTGLYSPGYDPAVGLDRSAPTLDPDVKFSATAAQLKTNQRISQAAVRRTNILLARLEAGLTTADFVPGTITRTDLVGGVR